MAIQSRRRGLRLPRSGRARGVSAAAALAIGAAIAWPRPLLAWESTGHRIVSDTAAALLSQDGRHAFLRRESFALAYYAAVPDRVWKQDETLLAQEAPEHWIELDRLRRDLGEIRWLPQRRAFRDRYPTVAPERGRVLWRIAELDRGLSQIATTLAATPPAQLEQRRRLQDAWLVQAGLLSHYLGDLAVPMHVTENANGQLSDQAGLHAFVEADLLQAALPDLAQEVWREAARQWPEVAARPQAAAFDVALALARDSARQLATWLARDRELGRADPGAAAAAFAPLLRARLVVAALTVAAAWQRHLGWRHDGSAHRLLPTPPFIPPGHER